MSKTLTISDELYQRLVELSNSQTCPEKSDDEYFNAYEWSGGNFDDAYADGVSDGYIELAREITEESNEA